jgi:hypothetical protein
MRVRWTLTSHYGEVCADEPLLQLFVVARFNEAGKRPLVAMVRRVEKALISVRRVFALRIEEVIVRSIASSVATLKMAPTAPVSLSQTCGRIQYPRRDEAHCAVL